VVATETPTPLPPELTVRRIGGEPKDQEAAEEKFREMMSASAAQRGEIQALHMDVVYRATNTQIKHTDVYLLDVRFRGKLNFEDANFYLHSAAPTEIYVAAEGGDVVMYRPRLNETLTIKKDAALDQSSQVKELLREAQKLGIASNVLPAAEEAADEAETKESKVRGVYLVGDTRTTLVEETRRSGKRVTTLKVWMNQKTALPVRIEKTEQGTRQVFDFTKIVINPPAKPGEFKVPVPKGAKPMSR
jgi:outer membrane lipoprotein-sorting protein